MFDCFLIDGLHLDLAYLNGQVNDDCALEDPFHNFRIGQMVTARIIAKASQPDNKKNGLWELSIKPKVLAGRVICSRIFLLSWSVLNLLQYLFVVTLGLS